MSLCVGASVFEGMLLRTGAGELKHLSTKQLWVQGVVQSYGVEVLNVHRAESASDILTQPVGGPELRRGLRRVRHHTRE